MAEYILHCMNESGNAYKAGLMLKLCDADWEARFVDYFGGETRTEAYKALNPMGEIPVLEHDGIVLTQSGVILDYLAENLGQFGPENATERREILRWLLFDNHKLTGYTATLRFMRQFNNEPENETYTFLEGRSKAAITVLDNHLENSKFALGDRVTIADISMCGYMFFRDQFGFDMEPYPNLLRWLDDIQALNGWAHPYDLLPSS